MWIKVNPTTCKQELNLFSTSQSGSSFPLNFCSSTSISLVRRKFLGTANRPFNSTGRLTAKRTQISTESPVLVVLVATSQKYPGHFRQLPTQPPTASHTEPSGPPPPPPQSPPLPHPSRLSSSSCLLVLVLAFPLPHSPGGRFIRAPQTLRISVASHPMSPAAGGPAPAPAQSAAAVPQAIAAPPEPGRVAPAASRRDPPGHPEGADPANAAARKPVWSALSQPPAAATAAAAGETPEGGGIIGGDASWPALAETTRACPKSGSSDSLKALSDASGPSPQVLNLAIKSLLYFDASTSLMFQ